MKYPFMRNLTQVCLVVLLTGLVYSVETEVRGATYPLPNITLIKEYFKPFSERPRTLNLMTSDSLWNTVFVDPNKNRKRSEKVDSIKTVIEPGIIDGTFSMRKTHQGVTILHPAVMRLDWFTNMAFKYVKHRDFRQQQVDKLTKPQRLNNRGSNAGISIISTKLAGTNVNLIIKGSINIDGAIIFQDQEQTSFNQRDSKSWDLDINQRQQFDITGTIGDRLSILVNQNSEADFAWENNLILKYQGKEDDIWQRGEAGNIGLRLPGTTYVNDGGAKSEGLFGVKLEHQLGPLKITSIVSREQVKSSTKSVTGGEAAEDYTVKDSDFVRDRYFFIDETFKNQYYPLNSENSHLYDPNNVIGRYQVYKTTLDGTITGSAHLDPSDPLAGSPEQGQWKLLIDNVDYELHQEQGYIRFMTTFTEEAIGIAYTLDTLRSDQFILSNPPMMIGDWGYEYDGEAYVDANGNGAWDQAEVILWSGTGNFLYDFTLHGWYDDQNSNAAYDEGEEIGIYYDAVATGSDGPWYQDQNGDGNYNSGEPLFATSDPEGNAVYNAVDQLIFVDHDNDQTWDEQESYTDADQDGNYDFGSDIVLKLIKNRGRSTPTKDTWPLMFKNVYSMGATNIDQSGFKLDIVDTDGTLGEETHAPSGLSFLHIFGLDSENENFTEEPGGDGIVDPYYIDFDRGELFFPTHLPFAYDTTPRTDPFGGIIDQFGNPEGSQNYSGPDYWGSSNEDLSEQPVLNDPDGDWGDTEDSGPAMYYSTNSNDINDQSRFSLKIEHSQRSSSLSLGGFMIVEGSEEIRLNGRLLKKDIDYSIDYFSGNVNFIDCPECTDPTAKIKATFQENEWLSFDQKILAGTALELNLNDNFTMGLVGMYYNQSIVDEKVDIGYEPVRNFIYDVNGSYTANNVDFLTNAVNALPFVETSKPSSFQIEGEFAEVFPNPNPLGQAFIDDFESSKRTTSPSIMQRLWKMASPPEDKEIINRGKLIWFNPYQDTPTREIWPNQEVSSQADNQSTRILILESLFQSDTMDTTMWNGITTPLYTSEQDQSNNKFLDIWLNTEDVLDTTMTLHIDIGHISEDINNNGFLDTEDMPSPGALAGNGILADEEDIGYDGCTDEYEDGFGDCLPTGFTYSQPGDNPINTLPGIDPSDPNGDNWAYTEGSADYSAINGTEGNRFLAGSRIPDTEDLDGNNAKDFRNDYFTYALKPLVDEAISYTDYNNDNIPNWQLFRIMLSDFERRGLGGVTWEEVPSVRLWIDGIVPFDPDENTNRIKIAKLEMVGNEWVEMGVAHVDTLVFQSDSTFALAVANTDENSDYDPPPGVQGEYDEYNGIRAREQSLVLLFEEDDDGFSGGIEPDHLVSAKKILNLPTTNNQSFFAYRNMEMFVFGSPSDAGGPWFVNDTSNVQMVMQFGRDDHYYEIIKPIYEGWDERNHINLDMADLAQYKLGISSLDQILASQDTGIDSVANIYESGGGFALPTGVRYNSILDSLITHSIVGADSIFNTETWADTLTIFGPLYWQDMCATCSFDDPNGDDYDEILNPTGWEGNEIFNWLDCGDDGLCPGDTGYISADDNEGNGLHDPGERSERFTDSNANGIFDPKPDNYNEDLGIWEWSVYEVTNGDSTWIETVRVKGDPAINRIKYVQLGVRNKTNQTIYGKVLVDELRMTNVKKERGKALSLRGSLKVADLMDVTTTYSREDADFHSLRQRLGTGDNSRSFSITTKFNPDIFLPPAWGVKTPINFTYSNQESSPKYRSGTDILAGTFEEAPDSLKNISTSLKFSTRFQKNARSDNWFTKYTLDKFSITNLSAVYNYKSTVLIEKEESWNYKLDGKYSITFSENYFQPFKFLKKTPVIGGIMEETRLYWSPTNLDARMSLEDNKKITYNRNGTITDPDGTLKMNRDFNLKYKLTKSLSTDYGKNIKSNLGDYWDDKARALAKMTPGRIESVTEQLSNSYSPDFMTWLKPKIKYNLNYNWVRNTNVDSLAVANISSKRAFDFSTNFSFRDMIEMVYTPKDAPKTSRQSSSRRSSRSRNSSNQTVKKIQVENPILVAILKPLHSAASKLQNVNFSYKKSATYDYKGKIGNPGVGFKLGLETDPNLDWYEGTSYSSNHQFKDAYSLKTGIILFRNLTFNVNYSDDKTTSKSSGQKTTTHRNSYLPLGDKGRDGLPFFTWSTTMSGLEKLPLLGKIFKSVSLSHTYNGEKNESRQDSVLTSETYTRSFSPLVGINTKTKGKYPLDISLNFKHTLTINNNGSATDRTVQTDLSSTIKYNMKGGLNIPLFFFRDFDISNDIKLSMNIAFTDTKPYARTTSEGDFELGDHKTNFSIKPNITYSFTKYVSGGMHFTYQIATDERNGRRTTKDFGFNVRILIQG